MRPKVQSVSLKVSELKAAQRTDPEVAFGTKVSLSFIDILCALSECPESEQNGEMEQGRGSTSIPI